MSNCYIIADLVDLELEPVPGVKLTVGVKYPTALAGMIISDSQITAVTNTFGRAAIVVPQGVTLEAWFPPIKRKLVFSTTGHDSINLADVLRQMDYPEPDPLLTYPPSPHMHSEQDVTGVVKTVNGESPDANGNIVLTGTGGEAGHDGHDGRGITSITKTSTSGLIDTYTVSYTDGTSSFFSVTNGAAGQTGANGANGAAGQDGASGQDGHSPVVTWVGTTIYVDGVAGPDLQGSVGANGLSAYQIAVANGFIGDEAAWLFSLIGETGPQGAQGLPGADGAKGDKGDTGAQGIQGIQGVQGSQGIQGPAGADATLILPPNDGKIYVMRNQTWEELEIS